MKKSLIIFLILFVLLIPIYSQKKIYQYSIDVKNKIVYARVFLKGELVDNLTKDDFILYENGKKVKIRGVDIIHKTFAEEEFSLNLKSEKSFKPRFFILTFKIIDYSENLEKGINYLFNNVLRKEDKLMFMSEHYYFMEDNLNNKERVKEKIIRILKKESITARMRLNRILSRLKSLTQGIKGFIVFHTKHLFGLPLESTDFAKLEKIVERFVSFLREYKARYLTPEIDKFYYFSEYLNGVKLKKWVINFYQFEKIPIPVEIKKFIGLSSGGSGEDIYSWATVESKTTLIGTELEEELNQPGSFPSDEVARLFYKGDTTFYTILLNKSRETGSRDFYYKEIYTDLEKTLKEISHSTGGDVILSNNIIDSINKFKKKKDIIYMLNYTPKVKSPKIKIRMNNSQYKVQYDPEQFSDFIEKYLDKKKKENPEIIINNFKFSNNSLKFSINNFKMAKKRGKKRGKILVLLKIMDEKGKVAYNAKKTMLTNTNSVKIGIGLNSLKPAVYYLYLDVYDLLTKKMTSKFEIITIK
jgi:hypothetical protein